MRAGYQDATNANQKTLVQKFMEILSGGNEIKLKLVKYYLNSISSQRNTKSHIS